MGYTVIFGGFGVLLALMIAVRQQIQLGQLKKIGEDTGDTAKKLQADTYTRELVQKFFFFKKDARQVYKCVFPVNYDKRPLPSIVAGDYHALHVLQNLIGAERVELVPTAPESVGGEQEIPDHWVDGNIIFLCAPVANRALHELAPPVDYRHGAQNKKPTFGDIELPCWFAIEPTNPLKKIYIPESERLLESPSDGDYAKAAKLAVGEMYEPSADTQVDYAILMRLTEGGRRIIVVAGIHQYGTWIGGDFLERLATGRELAGREELESEKDFVAVIWGEFNSRKYQVGRCGIHEEFLWTWNDGRWQRVSSLSKS